MNMKTFTLLASVLTLNGCAVASDEALVDSRIMNDQEPGEGDGTTTGTTTGDDTGTTTGDDTGTTTGATTGSMTGTITGTSTGSMTGTLTGTGTGSSTASWRMGDPINAIVSGSPGDILLFDDFEAGGATWFANVENTWALVTDETQALQQQYAVDDTMIAVGGHESWANIYVEARVKMLSGSDSDDIAAVMVRCSGENDFYYAAFQGDGSLKLRKRSDGSNSSIGTTYNDANLVQGTWYTIGIEAIGSTINLYLDGQLVQEEDEPDKYSATDSDLTAGFAGFGTLGNATAIFDDITVSQR